jgi:hypothetical protein
VPVIEYQRGSAGVPAGVKVMRHERDGYATSLKRLEMFIACSASVRRWGYVEEPFYATHIESRRKGFGIDLALEFVVEMVAIARIWRTY